MTIAAQIAARECAGIAGTLHQQLMRLQTEMACVSGDEADRLYEDLEAVSRMKVRLSMQAARIGRRK